MNEEGSNNSLLNIFRTEEDKTGNDILAMSNFFELFSDFSFNSFQDKSKWTDSFLDVSDISLIFGQLSSSAKLFCDIKSIGTLIADTSKIPKDIQEGLKNGIYELIASKKVSGNFTNLIRNKKTKDFVAQITLKRSVDPSNALDSINSMALQATLKQISFDLQVLNSKVDYIIQLNRRENLCKPFLLAREAIIRANNNPDRKIAYLEDADRHLSDGLCSLYLDLNGEVERLDNLGHSVMSFFKDILFGDRTKCKDEILGHIDEDIMMISKYVAVQDYILEYMERYADASNVIEKYKSNLKSA